MKVSHAPKPANPRRGERLRSVSVLLTFFQRAAGCQRRSEAGLPQRAGTQGAPKVRRTRRGKSVPCAKVSESPQGRAPKERLSPTNVLPAHSRMPTTEGGRHPPQRGRYPRSTQRKTYPKGEKRSVCQSQRIPAGESAKERLSPSNVLSVCGIPKGSGPLGALPYGKGGFGRVESRFGRGENKLRMYVRKNAWQTFQNKVQ